MAIGTLDANGVWIYGEDDPASPVSDLLNLGEDSVSDAVGDAKARLTALESSNAAASAVALTLAAGWTAIAGYAPPTSYKGPGGIVVVQGTVRRTGATITADASGTIATLAVGHRPSGPLLVSAPKDTTQITLNYATSGAIAASQNGTWTQDVSYVSLQAVLRAA